MSYLGQWQIDDTLTFTVTTHTFATGALTDADSVPSYRVYEDETGTAILTGSMAKLDDTNTTGHYSEQLTLSAANGFEVGKTYSIYITATVSSVTGGAVRSFQVEEAVATASALATVDTVVDAILLDTAEIGAAGAGLTALATAAALETVDTNVDAILVDTDATIPALIAAIGSGTGAALNFAVVEDNAAAPIKGVSSVGTQTGTYANTIADDGTTHQIDSVANAFDWIYGFSCGAAMAASKFVFRAAMSAVGDTCTVQAYNFTTTNWDTRTTISGTAETLRDVPLLAGHTGTGADEGKVYLRFVFSEGDAGAIIIDEAYVQAQQSGSLIGYANGSIWVDTTGGTAGTTPYVNGTADNPVDSWADALTLATATGLTRFKITSGSSITLTADSSGYAFLGDGLWSLDLNGQTITNAYIEHANISGIGAGSGVIVNDSRIAANASIGPAFFVRCGFNTPSGSPFVSNGSGEYAMVDCVSLVAGSGTPYFNFAGEGAATGVNFRRWSGGSNIILDSNNTLSMEVVTGGGQTITTGGGNVEIRGICRAVTVTSSGASVTQFDGVTGPVIVNGTGGTVRLYGVTGDVTDNSSGTVTIVNDAISQTTVNAEADTAISDAALATAAALATVDGIVDDILVDTGTTLPAQVAALNNVSSGDVQTAAAAALTAYDPPTKAELDSAVSPLATAAALATVDTNVDSILADTGTDGVVLSAATAQAIADAVLSRGVSNVESTADQDSLAQSILASFHSVMSGTTWTIYKTDDATTFVVRGVQTDAAAAPVVGANTPA